MFYIFHSWVLGAFPFSLTECPDFSTLSLRPDILYHNLSKLLVRLLSEFVFLNFQVLYQFGFSPRDDISLFNYIFMYFIQLFVFSLSSFWHLFIPFSVRGLRLLIIRVIIESSVLVYSFTDFIVRSIYFFLT